MNFQNGSVGLFVLSSAVPRDQETTNQRAVLDERDSFEKESVL